MSGGPGRLLVLGPAARSGGSQRYVSAALPRIAAGWDGPVTLALPGTALARLPEDLRADVEVLPLERPRWARGALHVLPTAVTAARLIRAADPAVVLTLGNLAYSGPRRPTVVLLNNAARLRDLRWASPGFAAYVALLRLQYRWTSWRATRAIAVSAHLRDLMPRRLRGDRTAVVHHGVDVATAPAAASASRGGSDLRILLPGSVVPYRGLERVLRAVAGDLLPRARLRVAGLDGPAGYRRRVERLATRLGLHDRLDWLGPLAHEALLAEMAAATHVVISSRTEACPNTLFEAAAVAPHRPVLAFDDPWSVEYADLLDARVPEDGLAAAIARTAGGSTSATVDRRRAALADATWDRCAARTLSVLRAAAAGRPGPGPRRRADHG